MSSYRRKGVHSHAVATVALSLVAVAAIIGGCNPSVPIVTSTNPPQNATDVPSKPVAVEIDFNQPMNEASVENSLIVSPGVPVKPVFSWAYTASILTVTFQEGLGPDTEYTMTVSTDAQGANGVHLDKPFTLKFTTGTIGAK